MGHFLPAVAAAMLFPVIAAAQVEQDVDIALDAFGVSSVYRPGDFAGVRFQVTSRLEEPVQAQVVWEAPEGLGDIAEYTRIVALTPGLPTSVWMYAKLLPTVDNSTVYRVRVFEDRDGVRGRELGAIKIDPQSASPPGQTVPRTFGMILLVGGPGTAGLADYNVTIRGQMGDPPVTGHEQTALVSGVAPRDLPDRWEGLDCFQAIVWTDAQPGALSIASANALREYVARGGHLVISLAGAGNDWQIGSLGVTPLHDLLPQTAPSVENVTTIDLLPVLSKRTSLPTTANIPFAIRVFETIDNDYQPLIALPDGKVVAVQKLHGFGRITVVGIELHSGQIGAIGQTRDGGGSMMEADTIWNRILGRRQDTLRPSQLAALNDQERLYRGSRPPIDLGEGQTIMDEINLRGEALAGVTFAFVLFVAYWLLAGPVGFAMLRSAKKTRHAWVAFAAVSALFTALAWGGVKLFSRKDVQVQHFTVLDVIGRSGGGGELDYRATSWFTVFLPGYGKPLLSVESDPGVRNILAPFSPPGVDQTRFRNVDRYVVPFDSPDAYEVPARSTTKEMYVRWMGDAPDETFGEVFEIISPLGMGRLGTLNRPSGEIGHSLPGVLRNVDIILIEPKRLLQPQYRDGTGVNPLATSVSGGMLNDAQMWTVPEWRPHTTIQLDAIQQPARFDQWLTRLRSDLDGERTSTGMSNTSSRNRRRYIEALSYFMQLPPPTYLKQPQEFGMDAQPLFERHLARELDLSPWFASPTLIITGWLENAPMPVPFRVYRERPQSTGLTYVRLIIPLPVSVEDVKAAEPEPEGS